MDIIKYVENKSKLNYKTKSDTSINKKQKKTTL